MNAPLCILLLFLLLPIFTPHRPSPPPPNLPVPPPLALNQSHASYSRTQAFCPAPLLDLLIRNRPEGGAGGVREGSLEGRGHPPPPPPRPPPQSLHQILMACTAFSCERRPTPNTITSNKQPFCFNHTRSVYMINATSCETHIAATS